jgi:hypothetical protein
MHLTKLGETNAGDDKQTPWLTQMALHECMRVVTLVLTSEVNASRSAM